MRHIADASMQMEALGRLPADVATGGRANEPLPEYMAEAKQPSADVWAREQERYREKQRREETGS